MRPYKIKIAPGEVYDLAAVGDYVRIKSAVVPVTVEATQNNESAELEQGDDVNLSPFSRLSLSHADLSEQSVTVYIGNGTRAGGSKVGGAVSVSNFPATQPVSGSVSVSNFPATQPVSGSVSASVTTPEQPQVYGASYKSTTALAANTAEAVFTAAQNVNGAVLHRASFVSLTPTSVPTSCFLSKATAPSGTVDGDVVVGADDVKGVSSAFAVTGRLEKPIKIPAGQGLFFISSLAENAGSSRSALYTLL